MTLSKAIFYISLFIQQSIHGRFLCARSGAVAEGAQGEGTVPVLKDSVENENSDEKRALQCFIMAVTESSAQSPQEGTQGGALDLALGRWLGIPGT